MDERFQKVCDLFEEARRLPAGAPRARLLEECDQGLRPDVESMLRHHEQSADPDAVVSLGPALTEVWKDAERPNGQPRRCSSA